MGSLHWEQLALHTRRQVWGGGGVASARQGVAAGSLLVLSGSTRATSLGGSLLQSLMLPYLFR